jgi:thiol:disulfide interchange protein DsbA
MFKRFLFAFVALTIGALSFSAIAADDYITLNKQGRLDKPGMIEVREFFWYGCPHCYKLEPFLDAWLKTKPADVNYVRTPAALNPVWEASARGYYTMETLGLVEKTHQPLFQAIHIGRQNLFDQNSLTRFYSGFGVSPTTFSSTYNSFAVSGKVAQSKNLAQFYGLDGVPAVVVNGKYIVKGESQKVIDTVNALIAKERAAQKK